MKVRIDIDSQLWSKFRAKVHHAHLALDEVVTKVVEPALQAYVEPKSCPTNPNPPTQLTVIQELPILDRITPNVQVSGVPPSIRRCDSCDMPTERLFASNGKSVCYACWKAVITAIPVPERPTDTPPEAA